MTTEILQVRATESSDVALEISRTSSGEVMLCEPYDDEAPTWFSIIISPSDWEHIKAFIDRQFPSPKSKS